eukprot:s3552_g6.t2
MEEKCWQKYQDCEAPDFFEVLDFAQDGGFSEVHELWNVMRYVGAVLAIGMMISNLATIVINDTHYLISSAHIERLDIQIRSPRIALVGALELILLSLLLMKAFSCMVWSLTTDNQRLRWSMAMTLFWETIPELTSFSAMRLLHFATPSVVIADLFIFMEYSKARGKHDGRFTQIRLWVQFVLGKLACFVLGIDAFLFKVRIAYRNIHKQDIQWFGLLSVAMFIVQVLGIVQLSMFVRGRIFLFIFGGEDSVMEPHEQALQNVWQAMLACALALSTRNRLAGPTASRPITVASLKARVSSRHSSIEHSGVGSLPLDALHDATMSSPTLSRVMTSTAASYMAPSKLSPREEPKSLSEGSVSKRRATSAEVDALQEPAEDEHAPGFDFRTVILAASVRKVQRIWRSKIKRSLSNVFKDVPEDVPEAAKMSTEGEIVDLAEGEFSNAQGHDTLPIEPIEPRASVSTIGGNDLRDTLPCDLEMLRWRRGESPATEERLEDGDDAVTQERSVEDDYPANNDLMDDLVLQERSVGVKVVDPAAEEREQLEVAVDLQESPQHHQDTQAQQSPFSESGGKLAEIAGEDPLSDRSQSIPSPSHLIRAVCTDKPNVNSSNVSESVRSEGAVSGDDGDSPVEQKNDVAEVEHVEAGLGIPSRDRSSASMASDPMEPGSHSRDAHFQ